MHSIGHFVLERNPDMKVIYVTSESFTNEVIDSIRGGNAAAMTSLRDKYRTVDVLMIDDIQFIIGKESTQEEFFHNLQRAPQRRKTDRPCPPISRPRKWKPWTSASDPGSSGG